MFSHWTDLTEVVRTDTGQGYFCATSVEFETWSKPWLPDCHGSSRCMWLTFSSVKIRTSWRRRCLAVETPDLRKVQSIAAGRNDSQSKVQIADYGGIFLRWHIHPSTLGISGCTSTEVVQGGALLGPGSNFASCIMKKYCGRQILQNLLRVFRRFFAWWTFATRTESAAGRPSQPMPADGTGRDPIANFGCPPLSPWNPIKRRPVRILLVRKLWRTWSPFWRQSLRSWRSKSASSMETNQSPKNLRLFQHTFGTHP